jgi:glutathione S-transferase
MLTLYHGLASTCSKKVRMCLKEKGLEYESQLLNLQKYEQHHPDYLKLNPKGVVPTLVHDGKPIIESTLIIEYLDEAFPLPALHPSDAYGRHKMRLWTKWSDDVGYNSVYVPTWEKLSRPGASRLDDAALEKMLERVPTEERRRRWAQTARRILARRVRRRIRQHAQHSRLYGQVVGEVTLACGRDVHAGRHRDGSVRRAHHRSAARDA